jgi:fermentation-respiration switch protein FrsA (DUF1100 family)
MKKITTNICLMLVIYGAACGYLFIYQRNLIYHPDKQYVAPNAEKLPDVQEITLKTEDGLTLDGWYVPSKNDKIVLYFNGNKSGMHLHENFYAEIVKAGYGLLTFNYRGYGKNAGEPSEQGLYDDAHAAISYLQKKKIPLESVIFLGRSLGSGVAMQMATEYLPHALVLISPYSSIAAVAKMKFPYIPIDLLLLDKFDSLSKAAQIASPTFIFHGSDDTLISPSEGEKLHQAIHDSKLFIYENQDHNNLNFAQIMVDLQASLTAQENVSKAH